MTNRRIIGKIHLEATTDQCTCTRLAGCGGIEEVRLSCPEHGTDLVALAKIHSHPLQVRR